jgi:hypothetical protein
VAPKLRRLRAGLIGAVLFLCLAARADQTVYSDSLQNGWQNYGWATLNYNNTSPVHSGTYSISVTSMTNWQALSLHHIAQDASAFTNITFWINGGSVGGQVVQVQATRGGTGQVAVVLAPLPVNSWRQDTVSLAALGVATATDWDGFWIQVQNNSVAPTLYVDDIFIVASGAPPVINTPVTITVDAQLNRHPISPLIYGTAFAYASSNLTDLNAPIHRSGGNTETRYNWQINAHNHAADWFFESLADSPATPGAATDNFITSSKGGSAEAMITIPMIGWVPKLGPSRGKLSGYSIAKYGPQMSTDVYMPDAGNGVATNSSTHTSWLITTNDPSDADFPTNSAFQQTYVQHLISRWGLSTNGGVKYYLMDNEHTLWHSTHRDVHPIGTTMQEIRDNFFDYAGMVKALDPNALVLAPEEWGWPGYLYSGYDQQWSGAQTNYNPANYPDRQANGGWDYGPWLLDQLHQRATNTNQRLLDYFTYHCYPQGVNESGNDVSTSTQLGRNRSTRAFWDTNYVDASWINNIIMLIPRMKNWVATYYPGTKIGVTEYNWGAEGHINGATAQADILGIFGREGLDLATRWTTPTNTSPTYKAMKMYRNYDGNNSGFGDTSVNAAGPNPDNVSTFAAVRSSDGALTVMVINKQLTATATATIVLTNFYSSGAAKVWQLTSANTISHLSDLSFTGVSFTNTVPAQSITLFAVSAGTPPRPNLRAGTLSSSNSFDLWLDGQAGLRYALQSSSDFVQWIPEQTNTLVTNSYHFVLAASSAPYRFYRAQWVP